MKVKTIIVSALLTCAAAATYAQDYGDIRSLTLASQGNGGGLQYGQDDVTFDTGARISGGVSWSIIPKRFSVSLDEELRIKDNFSNFNKSYTSAAAEYRILPFLKTEASYSFIMTKNSSGVWRNRHRGALSLTGTWSPGRWKFSLKEKLQATYKAYDINLFQAPRTDLALKTRIKVSYDFRHSRWEPYASVEIRNTLNAVNPDSFIYGKYTWEKYDGDDWVSKSRTCYGNLSPSYSDIYINRLRFQAGTEYKFRKDRVLTMYVVVDCNYDMPVDFSSNGIQKSYSSYLEDNPSSDISENNYYSYGTGILTLQDSYYAGIGLSFKFKL